MAVASVPCAPGRVPTSVTVYPPGHAPLENVAAEAGADAAGTRASAGSPPNAVAVTTATRQIHVPSARQRSAPTPARRAFVRPISLHPLPPHVSATRS